MEVELKRCKVKKHYVVHDINHQLHLKGDEQRFMTAEYIPNVRIQSQQTCVLIREWKRVQMPSTR
jgi:hypothetical protein